MEPGRPFGLRCRLNSTLMSATVLFPTLGLWLAGVFWLGLLGYHGTPRCCGLGRDLFLPVPLTNLLLWPLSLPLWLAVRSDRPAR